MKTMKQIFSGLLLTASTAVVADSEPLANVNFRASSIEIQTLKPVDALSIRIAGAGLSFQQALNTSASLLDATSLGLQEPGVYDYEITGVTYTGDVQTVSGDGRAPGAVLKKSQVSNITGQFTFDGRVITSGKTSPTSSQP